MPSYKFNEALGGIEIYFETKPSESMLEELKGCGWRWHRSKKCWYTRKSKSTITFAERICGSTDGKQAKRDKTQEPPNILPQTTYGSVSYNIVSGNTILSQVSIARSGDEYTVDSTNNQIICSDCKHMFSIHAQCCPFCGCPLSYVLESSFNEFYNKMVEQQKREEDSRKLAEKERIEEQRRRLAAEKEEILAQQRREREERKRIQLEEQRRLEQEAQKRANEIKSLCTQYQIQKNVVDIIIDSKVSVDELKRRIERIMYYQREYPHLDILLDQFVAADTIDDYIRGKTQSEVRRICTGICSNCTRTECIEDKYRF